MKILFVDGKPVPIHPITRSQVTELSRWAITYAKKWGGMVTLTRDDFLAVLDQAAQACAADAAPEPMALDHSEVLAQLSLPPAVSD